MALNDRLLNNVVLAIFLWIPFTSSGQSNNYWTRSFNEESSLLSGAVVGGGSGPSAIYYNPASISEVKDSKFSLNASLFSFDFNNARNALGDSLNLASSKGNIEPRFVSYMIKSKRYKNWSFEVAVLNNENDKVESITSVDEQMDILTNIPGLERYFAYYQFNINFRDDWIGAGGSVKLNDRLFLGLSMFVTIKSLEYTNFLSIEAFSPDDSIFINDDYVPFYAASYENTQYLKFNDYRLTWKGGLLYEGTNYSLGFSVTTPSIGGIYSDGKRDTRKEKQSNITMPGTGVSVPDYLVADYTEKKDMHVNFKTPFSVAAGLTYYFPDRKRTFYSSVEYFAGINPYPMVETTENPDLEGGTVPGDVLLADWLTYAGGAKPVFNVALGYSWTLKDDLQLMAGFRTDFNSKKNFDYKQYTEYNKVLSLNLDIYHITCGLSWNVLGQDIITGFQYSLGRNKGQEQIYNLSDPLEYNTENNLPIQGIRTNDMSVLYNSISLYFGASFNFGEEKQ